MKPGLPVSYAPRSLYLGHLSAPTANRLTWKPEASGACFVGPILDADPHFNPRNALYGFRRKQGCAPPGR
jgi:hypothetical protein